MTNISTDCKIDNFVTGAWTAASICLTMANSNGGGYVKNSKFIRGGNASSGHSGSLSQCFGHNIENCHFGIIGYARNTNARSILVSQCTNISLKDIYQYNTYIGFVTSFDCTLNNLDHCDRFKGDTNTTSGIYAVSTITSCNNIVVDGLTFGLKGVVSDFCNPYLSPFYSINSSNIKFRNAGTVMNPLLVNPEAASIYCVHDAGINTNVSFKKPTYTNFIYI